jgi:hypothetical protein
MLDLMLSSLSQERTKGSGNKATPSLFLTHPPTYRERTRKRERERERERESTREQDDIELVVSTYE